MNFLIIDDEIDVADLIQMFINLEFPNATVSISHDGKKGLEKIEENGKFDIIFCDFNMPKMNGAGVFVNLRAKHPKIPFVLVSSEDPTIHKEFDKDNNFYHIEKPFTDKDVNNLILKIMAGSKSSISSSQYVPISIDSLLRMGKTSTSIYLKISNEKYVKVFHPDYDILEEEINKYRNKKIFELYIERFEFENFIRGFRKSVFSRLALESTKNMEKIDIVTEDFSFIGKASKVFGWTPSIVSLAHENISAVLNVLKSEPRCKKIIEMMKSKSLNGIAQHSVILTILLTELCHRMGWMSQGTVEKLTFAAFLHDIEMDDSLFAEKQTILLNNDVEMLKETTEGNKIFSHPVDAAALTLNWPACPTDVDIIIRQHHEKPDGTGFPLGLQSFKISPLSAAFIMAEDLVYKTINEPDANLKDYFESRKEYYNREPFKSIYTKMIEIFVD